MSLHVESAGRGRPLVMLHGWGMHAGLWSPFLPRLTERYRVHLVDLPGHGYSAALGAPLSLQRMAEGVKRAVARVSSEPLVVMGWSWGGQIALEWARRDPSSVSSLVLLSTTPTFVQRLEWPHAMAEATLRRFGDELRVAYRPTLKRFVALQVLGSEHARDALASLRSHLFARGEPSMETLHATLELLAATDLRSEMGAISQPALVIAGRRDTMVPIAAARWLAGALPHAELVEIPGAAHAPFLSHPDAVVAALDTFASRR